MKLLGCTLGLVAALGSVGYSAPSFSSLSTYSHSSWTEIGDSAPKTVFAITQDQEGYLWLGLRGGLFRFDGTNFIRWETLTGHRLPGRDVLALAASRDGSLWVGFANLGGVVRIRDGVSQSYTSADGLPEGAIVTLLEDRSGTLWAGGYGGVARFRRDRWKPVSLAQGLSPAITHVRFHEDERGELWLATDAGLFHRSAESELFTRIESAPSRVESVTSDVAGSIWLTDGRGLSELGTGSTRLRVVTAVGTLGAELLRDSRGFLWMGLSGQGVLRIPTSSWSAGSAVERFAAKDGLTGDRVRSLFEDREGNIWIGTESGLDYLSTTGVGSVVRRAELAGRTVTAVTAGSNESVWTGTTTGLVHLSGQRATWYRERDGLPGNSITALHWGELAGLWVATTKGLARHVHGRFVRVSAPDGTALDGVAALTSDAEGGIWICHPTGVYLWANGTLKNFRDVPQVRGKRPVVAHTDTFGGVWIGFLGGGVVHFDEGRFHAYSTLDGVTAGRVSAIFEDREHAIWVGSFGGLSRFRHGRFLSLSEGPSSGHGVTSITQGGDGHLWVGTWSGLLHFSTRDFERAVADPSYQLPLYDRSDRLSGSFTWRGYPTSTRTPDGLLWFVKQEGLIVANPSTLPQSRPHVVRVDQIRVDQRQLLPVTTARPPTHPSRLELPTHPSRLQIEYSAPAFDAPARFRYILEGFDQGWVNVGTTPRAYYTNLPPRDYRFRVAASYDGRDWTESRAWEFSVPPAFYQTLTFYGASALTLTLIVWVAWYLRLRHVRHQYAVVMAERARLRRELHDTLLQGMAGAMLQVHSLAQIVDSAPNKAKTGLEQVCRALEHYMSEARRSIWELRSSADPQSPDLATALRRSGERITAGTGVDLTLAVHGVPKPCATRQRHQLLSLFGEAVSNAVHHAEASRISVKLQYNGDAVRLHVRDNGRGFDPEQVTPDRGAHVGLTCMRERAEQMGAVLKLISRPGQGTQLELTAPLVEQ